MTIEAVKDRTSMALTSKRSFFTFAAWYALIAPFVTAGITWLVLIAEGPAKVIQNQVYCLTILI